MNATTFADVGIDVRGARSGNVKTKCPQCRDQRKPGNRSDRPLSVNVEEGVWTCWNCGWSGCLNDRGIPPIRRQVYVKPVIDNDRTLRPKGRAFLESRRIDPDIAAEVGVYSDTADTMLAFPYHRHGEIVHVKYRSITDKRMFSTKDTEKPLYGHDDCAGSDTVLICEGELDRLALLTAGFIPSASVPSGAPQPGQEAGGKIAFLEHSGDVFNAAKKVIFATDNDPAGEALADEMIRRIGPEKCYRVTWPEGCKDANDVLMVYPEDGVARLTAAIDAAKPEPVRGIVTPADLLDRLLKLKRNNERGYGFGYPVFDTLYRAQPGLVTVVTGHSSHGKSSLIDQLLIRLVDRHGWHVGIFSPEQMPLERHLAQMLEQHTGLPFREGPSLSLRDQDIVKATEWAHKHFTFLAPDEPSLNAILELAKVVIFRTGAKGIVIDPWNEIEHSRPREMTETEYVSVVMRQIRQFATKHDVHIWLIAHPTKMPATASGEEQIPRLQSVAGSINFRNKADFGLSVYRDLQRMTNEVDILITKTRWPQFAQLGRVRFEFQPVNKRFIEIGAVDA